MTDPTPTPVDVLLARARRWAFLAPQQADPEEQNRLFLAAGKALSLALHRSQKDTPEAQA